MSDLVIPGTGFARYSWGRWVVDCSRPWCTSALTMGPDLRAGEQPDGHLIRRGLTWGDTSMECWDCGYVTRPVVWPRDPQAIEMLVGRRPDIRTRNWLPGETLADLLAENAAHGLMPIKAIEATERTTLLVTRNEVLVGGLMLDALPSAAQRREITGGQ